MEFGNKYPVAMSIALLFIVALSYSLLHMNPTSQSINILKNFVEETGSKGTTEIIGGTFAQTSRYPYFCLTGSFEPGGFRRVCGASLVHDDMILTAAHCVVGRPQLYVFCGIDESFDPNDPRRGYHGVSVEKVIMADGFDGATLKNDFALLKLMAPLTGVQKVNLNLQSSVPGTGQIVTAVGFGQTRYRPYSPQLKEANLLIASTSVCAPVGGAPFIESIMMCAQADGKGTCSGDSGGPIVIRGADATKDVQVAVSSFTSKFGCPDVNPMNPSYFARVSAWYDDIVRIVCAESAVASTSSLCSSSGGGGGHTCQDVPGWVDSHGTPCSWYAEGNKCEVYGTLWLFQRDGKRAKEACCACGGGV